MSKKSNKIILATGIFFPDVGGPAIHVRKIAETLETSGYRPVVIAYGDYDGPNDFQFNVIRISNKLPVLLRRLKYLVVVLKESHEASLLYAFNIATAGFPVFIVGKMLHKKIIMRLPGDPIWERVVERGDRFVSFVNYYKQGLYVKDRPWLFRFTKYVLPKFDLIVFYSRFLSDIYEKYYNIDPKRVRIILNPVFHREPSGVERSGEPTVLFAGRFVAYKNLELLIRVFDKVRQKTRRGRLVMIGEGPDKYKLEKKIKELSLSSSVDVIPKLGQEKLFEYIQSSWFGVGPALTEFNPNFILECLSLGRPVLLSRENGLSVKLPEEFLFDPQNEKEFIEKMEQMFSVDFYGDALNIVRKFDLSQNWERVTRAHLEIIKNF